MRALLFFVLSAGLSAQELLPKKLLEQPTDSWPTYNGDYSGRRFSPLQADQFVKRAHARARLGDAVRRRGDG
jgi:hypothetical protein